MQKMITSPGTYIQGRGEMAKLFDRCGALGCSTAYIIVDSFINENYRMLMMSGFAGANADVTIAVFGGECSDSEINRHIAALGKCDVIIGVGGGKTLDTAKAAAYRAGLPVIIMPTAASSDAPCSRLSVIYTDDGSFERYLPLPKNPDIVTVDTEIIANAPPRFLSAGLGDALATFYEADACRRSGAVTMAGGTGSLAALELARLCRDTLFSDGKRALLSVNCKKCTPALERIIEANTYLSGIGFESGGLAAAHAVHNGLTVLAECHSLLHGEKVAFGVLTQLMLENAPQSEFERVARFCADCNLPVTLAQLGLGNADDKKLMNAAKAACAKDDTMSNMPFEVTPDDVVAAMKLADITVRQTDIAK